MAEAVINRGAGQRFLDLLGDWRAVWWLLLLPAALLLPATPIDETRYIAVAWEMRVRGDFLVAHLNGAIYSEKTPLFFWLMNLDWLLVGIHVWAVRLSVLAITFGSLLLFQRLALRLSANQRLAQNATLLLAGMIFVALYSSLIYVRRAAGRVRADSVPRRARSGRAMPRLARRLGLCSRYRTWPADKGTADLAVYRLARTACALVEPDRTRQQAAVVWHGAAGCAGWRLDCAHLGDSMGVDHRQAELRRDPAASDCRTHDQELRPSAPAVVVPDGAAFHVAALDSGRACTVAGSG